MKKITIICGDNIIAINTDRNLNTEFEPHVMTQR